MSNYTDNNLISIPSSNVPAGTLAMKVGNNVFTAGNVVIGEATDFYKCATVIPSVNFDAAGGLDPADGLYVCQNGRMLNGYPVYRKGSTNYYLWSSSGSDWIITDVDPEDDLTEHILFGNNGTSDITDWPEPITVTYASSGTWTGYKAVFDAVTGTYSFEATVTSGLTYSVVTPAVGKVYADGALVKAELYEGIPTNGMVVLISGESLLTAETGQTMTATQSGLDLYTDSSLGSCLNFFRPSQYEDGGRLDCATGISSADSLWSFSTWIKRNSD